MEEGTDDMRIDPGPASDDVRIHRESERAYYDRATIDEIIDASLIAHVGTMRDVQPLVIPMFCSRDGDWLLLHGAPAAGTFRRGRGQPVCATMTQVDGLVLARSAFNHSINYRSVMVLGTAEIVSDEDERRRALDVITERLVPGRGIRLRPMSTAELRQTAVLRISLEHASAKVRQGPPIDEPEDYDWPIWAGVVPIISSMGPPQPDPRLADDIEVPDEVAALAGKVV